MNLEGANEPRMDTTRRSIHPSPTAVKPRGGERPGAACAQPNETPDETEEARSAQRFHSKCSAVFASLRFHRLFPLDPGPPRCVLRVVAVSFCSRGFALCLPVLIAIALTGCASRPKGAASNASATPAAYLRIAHPDENTIELQVASRRFAPARGREKGPAVWLVGASHIGESTFFAALQKQLDAHTLVLYEGVGEHSRRARPANVPSPAPPAGPRMKKPAGTNEGDYSLQDTMARSLGLVFQLQAIDYERTNFVNSDLSIAEIQALMQPGRSPAATTGRSATTTPGRATKPAQEDDDSNSSFQSLLSAMDGRSTLGVLLKGLMQLIGNSTKLQAMTKIALIETLGAMKGDPSRMKGLPADMKQLMEVLIRERNKTVIEDLRYELKRATPGQSIAIFYGAGHLADLETRLRKELKLRPAEDVWLPAFSVNTARAGLSSFELNFLRSMIRSQLAPLTE